MRAVAFALLCGAVAPVGGLPAQAGGQAADRIAGTWTGYLGQSESSRTAITVQLRSEGGGLSGTVTGPELTPGDIRRGSFDAGTGALRFEVVVRGGGLVVTFDGTVARDTASGRVVFPDQTGVFRIVRGAAGEAVAARPPAAADAGMVAARRGFTEVSAWVAAAAELVPADRYAYRPAATVRTFGQLVAHVADAYRYYCGRAGDRGGETEWSDAIEKGATDKATVVQRLKQAADGCAAAYGGGGRIGPLMENVAHTSLHYGNMITYLRLLGLVPPSS